MKNFAFSDNFHQMIYIIPAPFSPVPRPLYPRSPLPAPLPLPPLPPPPPHLPPAPPPVHPPQDIQIFCLLPGWLYEAELLYQGLDTKRWQNVLFILMKVKF